MPSLNRNEKVIFENCGTQITKLFLARHKNSCFAGKLYCDHCPFFITKSRNDLIYHIAKKHSAPKPAVTFNCKQCYQGFPVFYDSRQPKTPNMAFLPRQHVLIPAISLAKWML